VRGPSLWNQKDALSRYFLLTQKSDVYACIYNTEIFDFLIDIIPSEELKALKKYPAEGMFQILPSNRDTAHK
jgi:hypothetical protein